MNKFFLHLVLLSSMLASAKQAPSQRSYLPVPETPDQPATSLGYILNSASFADVTTDLCKCGQYTVSKSVSYTPLTTAKGGCPMIRITQSGVHLDLSHNCVCFAAPESTTCASASFGSHCVGIEVGYPPANIGGNTQPNSVVIENGIMCDWDVAILVHAGVRNVTIRNMVFSGNTIPLIFQAQDDGSGNITSDISVVNLENVYIVGSQEAELDCLKWIRSYFLDGTAQDAGPAASSMSTPLTYTTTAVMQRVDDPIGDNLAAQTNGTGNGAYVYAGIYAYGVTNFRMNNVIVNNIGYSAAAENTAAYGIWLRSCKSVLTQDLESSKSSSSQTVVGFYADTCDILSFRHANFSGNSIVENTAPGAGASVPEQLWAAGVVYVDCAQVNMSDVIFSDQTGYNNAWGVRTISNFSNYIQSYSLTDVWADGLIAQHVYGFDMGDVYAKFSGSAMPNSNTVAVHNLRMKNVSVCGCTGQGQVQIQTEFKGIYLGNFSQDIVIDGVCIENNDIADTGNTTPTYRNSGIEFGCLGGGFESTPPTDSGINGATFTNMSIMNNGISMNTANSPNVFAALRGVIGSSSGIFQDITLCDSAFQNTNGYGIFVGDTATGATTTGFLRHVSIDNVACDNNFCGILAGQLNDMSICNSSWCNNANGSIEFDSVVVNLLIDNCQLNSYSLTNGLLVLGGASNVTIRNCIANLNENSGFEFDSTVDNLLIDGCQLNGNGAAGIICGDVVTNASICNSFFNENGSNGLRFNSSVTNFSMDRCQVNSSLTADGIFVSGAVVNTTLTNCEINENGNCGFLANSTVDDLWMDGCRANSNQDCALFVSGIINNITCINSVFNENHVVNSQGALHFDETIPIEFFAPINNIVIDNCQINNNGSTDNANPNDGVFCAGATQNFILRNSVLNENADCGVHFVTSVDSVLIEGCQANWNIFDGFLFIVGSNIIIRDCQCNSNQNAGIGLIPGTNVHIADCDINENAGWGILATFGNNITIERCCINSSAVNDGILFEHAVDNLYISDCQQCNNRNGIVFSAAASNITFVNSVFNENTINGILFESTVDNLTIDGCQMNSNANDGVLVSATATNVTLVNSVFNENVNNGIEFDSTVDNLTIDGCQMNSNINDGVLVSDVATNMIVVDTIMNENITYGIEFDGTVNNLTIDGCCVNNNNSPGLFIGDVATDITLTHSTFNENADTGIQFGSHAIHLFIDGCQANSNAGNGLNTASASSNILIDHSTFNTNGAANVQINHGTDLIMRNSQANGCTSSTSYGFFAAGASSCLTFENCEFNSNASATGNAYGMVFDTACSSVNLINVQANYNIAGGNATTTEAVGIYMLTTIGSQQSENIYMNNVQACGNHNSYRSRGIHIAEPVNCILENIDVSGNASDQTGMQSSNPVLSQGVGLYLESGTTATSGRGVYIKNITACYNTQLETTAANLAVTSGSSEGVLNSTALIARHFPVNQICGAYGILAVNTPDITIEGGNLNDNAGVRGFGALFKSCNNVYLMDVEACSNAGTGTPFFSDSAAFSGVNAYNTPIAIPAAQRPTLFGNVGGAATINLASAYQGYMVSTSKVRNYLQRATTGAGTDWVCSSVGYLALGSPYVQRASSYVGGSYADQDVGLTFDAIHSILAQYRRFCTGVGIGLYTCHEAVLENCRAVNNQSLYDCAAGIVSYGVTHGVAMSSCYAALSQAWTASQRGVDGTVPTSPATLLQDGDITITAWQQLYTSLRVGLLDCETAPTALTQDSYGFEALPNTIVQANHIYSPGNAACVGAGSAERKPTGTCGFGYEQPTGNIKVDCSCNASDSQTWLITPRALTVGLPTVLPTVGNQTVPLYNFVGIGPVSAGILVDSTRDARITECTVVDNEGNAGLCAGILMDASTESLIANNTICNNEANALGYCVGAFDASVSTSNQWWGNVMSCNIYDTFMNMNFIIPFDPTFAGAFAYIRQNNGNITPTSAVERTSYYNIINEFVMLRQKQDYLANCVKTRWQDTPLAPGTLGTWSRIIAGGTANETLYSDELSAC